MSFLEFLRVLVTLSKGMHNKLKHVNFSMTPLFQIDTSSNIRNHLINSTDVGLHIPFQISIAQHPANS